MMQANNLKTIFLIGLSTFTSISFAQQKPNIVLILADDMGWGDINANGNQKIDTPVLNRLAKQSMIFNRF